MDNITKKIKGCENIASQMQQSAQILHMYNRN